MDDDFWVDGEDIPNVDSLPEEPAIALFHALNEAFITLDVLPNAGQYESGNVPFQLNVANDAASGVVAARWGSKSLNTNDYWVAYVLTAFQGAADEDADPHYEEVTMGITHKTGGTLIYIETNAEAAARYGGTVSTFLTDTVVHELGHALARHGEHPVTGLDAMTDNVPVGTTSMDGVPVAHHNPSKYQPTYLHWIRSTKKPYGND